MPESNSFKDTGWRLVKGFEKVRGTLGMSPGLLKQVDTWIGQCYGNIGELRSAGAGVPSGVEHRSLLCARPGRRDRCPSRRRPHRTRRSMSMVAWQGLEGSDFDSVIELVRMMIVRT